MPAEPPSRHSSGNTTCATPRLSKSDSRPSRPRRRSLRTLLSSRRTGFWRKPSLTNCALLFRPSSASMPRSVPVSKTLPDYALFDTLPGGGPALAPRLLTAFGEQRERFLAADELQRYFGIAPVTERSGNKSWIHWRWQCPKFLRQTLVEWAAQTINKSFWAGAYYRQQRAKGSSHQAALRALAFK